MEVFALELIYEQALSSLQASLAARPMIENMTLSMDLKFILTIVQGCSAPSKR